MRRIIDSHAHMEAFDDAEKVMFDCLDAGVSAVICVGGDLDSSSQSLSLAERYSGFFYPAIGVHPSNVLNTDLCEAVEFVSDNLPYCVALGEVGLDYAYDFARSEDVRSLMRDFLESFLEVASDFGLPASVHSRSAYRDTLDLVTKSGVEAVFHWYDGPLHTLEEIIDGGYYVSAAPAIEYSRGVQAVMLEAPLERILVETDSPVFLRSLDRRSRPDDVVRVVESLAGLKGLGFDEVAGVTARNTERLFRI